MSPMPRVNITVQRVQEMDEREMYHVTDCYVKNRLSRFAISPDDQYALEQREVPKAERESSLHESNEVYEVVKKQLYNILYSPEVLPRHRHALDKMRQSVEDQLGQNGDEDARWRSSARSFLGLVKDELARADVMLQQQQEASARRHLAELLDAIHHHRNADDEDVDDADDRLYAVADQIAEALTERALASA